MNDDPTEHLQARELTERIASKNAACIEASIAHLRMAERYADLVCGLEGEASPRQRS